VPACLATVVLALGLASGPSLPLGRLDDSRPFSIQILPLAQHSYEYRSDRTVSGIADELLALPNVVESQMWPASSAFKMVRRAGGVVQTVFVRRPALQSLAVRGHDGRTVVVVLETFDL